MFLQTEDFYCVLNSVNKPGCVFAQYMVIDQKQMINYSIRVVKQARFITVDRKSIYQMCNSLPDMREQVRIANEYIEKQGYPILDYQVNPEVEDANGIPIAFNPGDRFRHGVTKLIMRTRFLRKKAFKIMDLIRYLKRTELSEDNVLRQHANQIYKRLEPALGLKLRN